jgi:BON domain
MRLMRPHRLLHKFDFGVEFVTAVVPQAAPGHCVAGKLLRPSTTRRAGVVAHRPGTFHAAPGSMNKTDIRLKQDVEAELQWDPTVDAAEVGVSVENGAVSLRGDVDSYAAKWAVIEATKRVAGVRAVVEDLTVKLPGTYRHSDSEIAQAADARAGVEAS